MVRGMCCTEVSRKCRHERTCERESEKAIIEGEDSGNEYSDGMTEEAMDDPPNNDDLVENSRDLEDGVSDLESRNGDEHVAGNNGCNDEVNTGRGQALHVEYVHEKRRKRNEQYLLDRPERSFLYCKSEQKTEVLVDLIESLGR